MRVWFLPGLTGLCMLAAVARAEDYDATRWLERFEFRPPEVADRGVCKGVVGALPEFEAASSKPGMQLVRVSLPFAPGAMPHGMGLIAQAGGDEIEADFRELTLHPGSPASVRRGIVTFPVDFEDAGAKKFSLQLRNLGHDRSVVESDKGPAQAMLGAAWVRLAPDSVNFSPDGQSHWTANLIAPPVTAGFVPKFEVVEKGRHYLWVRLLVPDPSWPRILDVRMDSLGCVVIQAQIQRLEKGDATAPDLGWEIEGAAFAPLSPRSFSDGASFSAATADAAHEISFPTASGYRRGGVSVDRQLRYLRCTSDEKVPFQEAAWRTAEFVLKPTGQVARDELFQPRLDVVIDPEHYAPLHFAGMARDLRTWPVLASLADYTRNAIVRSMRRGDDFGNVTSFGDGGDEGSAYGMNRLNHAPAIFEEGWRSGDRRLPLTGALWCINMHDLSLWWGETEGIGGTRYNNATAAGQKEHEGDANFMWRTNGDSNFCTKGYDAFLCAYEETGDPRMLAALRAQVEYARHRVHCDQGECRNIGDVADFMRLYRATGVALYRDEAMRLFHELRSKLSTGDLFDQGGKPLDTELPFIDSDAEGYNYGYAKPYIIGYALAGLPELLREFPDEPKLRDCVRAVADFLAESVDPAGGWRYPHPRSGNIIINQGVEHAMQICRAAEVLHERGEPIENLLDAVETVLQARVLTYAKTGRILAGLNGWEQTTGALGQGQKLANLYPRPEDRDRSRDYTEGGVGLGGSSPEGIVYWGQVLDYYLRHRPAERLFNANPQLRTVLDRLEPTPPRDIAAPERNAVLEYGMKAGRPAGTDERVAAMNFAMSWERAEMAFPVWRQAARARLFESYLDPPARAEFDPEVLATEDRGSYVARKLAFNLSADQRVPAYLLVPRGNGPFPAIVALHDHGAHFSIGKEKVVRPFGVDEGREKDARDWVGQSYEGRFIGDELAARGYVVFAADALFWGDRGRVEGVDYEAQQQLAANMIQLGRSWAGVIAWDDLRSAEFVQSLAEVDPGRIGCIGLSMGASRAWHLAAASDIIKAGAAICWMGDTRALMAEGNNQTRGQSAFSMIHPGLRNALDYPDVASIACPKPMLFFNGAQDALFPTEGVERCYERMRRVWEAQNAAGNLVTKIWSVPHVFNVAMQEEAFAWLDLHLKRSNPR